MVVCASNYIYKLSKFPATFRKIIINVGRLAKIASYESCLHTPSPRTSTVLVRIQRQRIPGFKVLIACKTLVFANDGCKRQNANSCVSVSYRLQILRLAVKCLLLFSSKVLYPALVDHTRKKAGYIVNFTIRQV